MILRLEILLSGVVLMNDNLPPGVTSNMIEDQCVPDDICLQCRFFGWCGECCDFDLFEPKERD